MQEQWDACSAAIAARMPEQAYKTWIKPLAFLEFSADDCLIRLGAATQIKADIVRNQYQNLIQEVLRDVIDPAMRVEIGVAPRAASAAPVAGVGAAAATHGGGSSFAGSGPSHSGPLSHGVQPPAPHGGGTPCARGPESLGPHPPNEAPPPCVTAAAPPPAPGAA